jgi:predicted P-loop ATPase
MRGSEKVLERIATVGALLARSQPNAEEVISELILECRDGESDREVECVKLAELWKLDVDGVDGVRKRFARAREIRTDREVGAAKSAVDDLWIELVAEPEPERAKKEGNEVAEAAQDVSELPKAEPEPEPAQEKSGGLITKLAAALEAKPPMSFFQYSRTPRGIPASLENAMIAVKAMKLDCRYDEFHDKVIVKGYENVANGDVLENLDNTLAKLRERVLRGYGFDPGKEYLADALKIECLDHVFDPVRDYLDSLKWDGKPRVDTWLTRYCRAKDVPLVRAFGRKFLLAGVRRVRRPGCKFDYILTLEGDQGIGKSTLYRTLAGEENFCDNEILGLDKREQQEAIQGVWIYELAELEGIRKSDVTHIKLFASKTHDKARPAWGRGVVNRPRRTIFGASTNESDYLRDATGNRRFWPVSVGRIDLAGVARDRDQLWAEAATLEATGEALEIGEEHWGAAAIEQSKRREYEPWEETISDWHAKCEWEKAAKCGWFTRCLSDDGGYEFRISSAWLMGNVLEIPQDRQGDATAKRLTKVMRTLGWDRPTTPIRIGMKGEPVKGEPVRGFVKKDGSKHV